MKIQNAYKLTQLSKTK